ncbi:MAG: GNAT family N-acetyltransferase [Oligoflexia bacterium]|nr:GNAT family N-acetyltransferase [Oligoflexia bacterium]
MAFKIRRATHQDAQAIIAAHVRSIREVCSKDYTLEQIEAWGGRNFRPERWCETIDKDFVWVIEVDDKVQGFGHLALQPGNYAEIMGLYFAPEARGLGAGKKLCRIMKGEAAKHGTERLRLHSTITGKSFYEGCGFHRVEGECFVEMRGIRIPCFPMECSLAVGAAEKLDSLLQLPSVFWPRISPDGKWVAWCWFGLDTPSDIYVALTDGSAPPIRLTRNANFKLLRSWTRDSRAILITQDTDGDERATIYRVDIDAPEVMHPLTERNPPFFIRGGQLHPNGKWLVYAANFDVMTGREIEPTWIYRHDLSSGERIVLARPEKPSFGRVDLSPNGAHVLYSRKDLDASGEQVWVIDVDGKWDREILNFGADRKVTASWMPDSKGVVFLAETSAYNKVGVLDLDTSGVRWLIDDPTRNIESVFAPEGTDSIVVIEIKEARVIATLLDPKTCTETKLPSVKGDLTPIGPAAPFSGGSGEANFFL